MLHGLGRAHFVCKITSKNHIQRRMCKRDFTREQTSFQPAAKVVKSPVCSSGMPNYSLLSCFSVFSVLKLIEFSNDSDEQDAEQVESSVLPRSGLTFVTSAMVSCHGVPLPYQLLVDNQVFYHTPTQSVILLRAVYTLLCLATDSVDLNPQWRMARQ